MAIGGFFFANLKRRYVLYYSRKLITAILPYISAGIKCKKYKLDCFRAMKLWKGPTLG